MSDTAPIMSDVIKNGTAQNMNNDGGTNAVVKITPWSYGITV